MREAVSIGPLPGTYFCLRCARNRWFTEGCVCQFCGWRERRVPEPGGLNPRLRAPRGEA